MTYAATALGAVLIGAWLSPATATTTSTAAWQNTRRKLAPGWGSPRLTVALLALIAVGLLVIACRATYVLNPPAPPADCTLPGASTITRSGIAYVHDTTTHLGVVRDGTCTEGTR